MNTNQLHEIEKELEEDFLDDPDYLALKDEEKARLITVMERMLEMGVAVIYGVEDEGTPDSNFNCQAYLLSCKARCCAFHFALTKDEVKAGHIAYDKKKPFFIARQEDGYCPHLDRVTFKCLVYENRPLRCRRYDCVVD